MRYAISLCAAAVVGGALLASDLRAPGGSATYAGTADVQVGGKSVRLRLTGVAMRTKVIVNVYAIGSYVDAAAKPGSAEALASMDCAKRLHLVMERSVEGKDMAEAFQAAVRMNYAAGTFDQEVATLCQFMRGTSLRKGEHILLTHVPGVGLHCNVAGRADFTIKNARFSQAVWEIYLGQKNLGDDIKRGLTARL